MNFENIDLKKKTIDQYLLYDLYALYFIKTLNENYGRTF